MIHCIFDQVDEQLGQKILVTLYLTEWRVICIEREFLAVVLGDFTKNLNDVADQSIEVNFGKARPSRTRLDLRYPQQRLKRFVDLIAFDQSIPQLLLHGLLVFIPK